jgi:hypothetical protein
MPAVQMKARPHNSRRPNQQPPTKRLEHGSSRGRHNDRPRPAWLKGLRWVPVPLALLSAAIGVLVLGSFQGQVASATANQAGYRAGGLSFSVDTMLWMMNMKPSPGGYQMPASMMPGMQSPGTNRLRVEVTLADVSTTAQRYFTSDFSLSSPSGKTWPVRVAEHSDTPTSAVLEPGFQTVVDLYFDVPARQAKNLTLKWSRDGTTVSIPVRATSSGSMRM